MSKAKKKKDPSKLGEDSKTETLEQEEQEISETAKGETPSPEVETSEQSPDWEERYLRVAAEYDNYRRRSKRELDKLFQDATCAVVCELLPVLDSFDSALSMEGVADSEANESNATGINLIYKQLTTALNKLGVEEIEALGEEFDPTLHQAVMSVEDDNAGENEIVEVFQKGYKRGDFVIRHSMVKVAN